MGCFGYRRSCESWENTNHVCSEVSKKKISLADDEKLISGTIGNQDTFYSLIGKFPLITARFYGRMWMTSAEGPLKAAGDKK
ncbi:unnamed protein product [Cylicocyclus nassatus]|uniref:Uncharacterized protein n=1 Tax=Cylicocyclus nassatus TaxID=53992 RepID=A0AA36GEK1_CYLNA|nr:unnamed protein product [Cylicocyclus nassatus]